MPLKKVQSFFVLGNCDRKDPTVVIMSIKLGHGQKVKAILIGKQAKEGKLVELDT